MTNVRSASNAWGAIKKKLFADMTTQSPGSAKKRKAPTAKATDGGKKGDAGASDDDDQVDETPTKKRARSKAKPKTKKEEADVKKEDVKVKKEEDSDDDNAKAKEHEVVNVDGSEGSAGVEAGASDAV